MVKIGTPGVGKSTLCQQIAERTNFQWLEVGKLAKENNCYEEFDEVYRCPVLHEDKASMQLYDSKQCNSKFSFCRFLT